MRFVARQLTPWRRTTVKQYHSQHAPVNREAKIMLAAQLFVLRDDGGVRAFVRVVVVESIAARGEVKAYDEPDGSAVGGVGEW